MSLDSAYLDEHQERQKQAAELALRDRAALVWLHGEHPPEVRLPSFDAWVRRQLDRRLEWGWAGALKAKRLEQCRLVLHKLVAGLWARGWHLDGKRLADRITGLLDAVGKAQREGKVRAFWPYFNAAVERFVGQNAEELKEEAMGAGMHVGQIFERLTARRPGAPAIPELIAQRDQETLREKLAKERAKATREAADAAQGKLF